MMYKDEEEQPVEEEPPKEEEEEMKPEEEEESMLDEEGAGEETPAPPTGEEGEEQGTRQQCPQCGSLSFKETEDKKKVVYYNQGIPIYARKGVCNRCGTEWELSPSSRS